MSQSIGTYRQSRLGAKAINVTSGISKRVLRKLIRIVPVVLGIAIINFTLLRLAPGDVVSVMAGEAGSGNAEYMAYLRQKFGLDQPLHIQLGIYLSNLAQFDLGFSVRHNMNVSALILERLPATMLLMLSTIAFSFVMGVVLGVIAAKNVSHPIDRAISSAILFLYATPLFWLGLMLIIMFSVKLGWFPGGWHGECLQGSHRNSACH